MQRNPPCSGGIQRLYPHQPVQEIEPHCFSQLHILENGGIQNGHLSFQACSEPLFTQEWPSTTGYFAYDTPSLAMSNRSPQGSHSGASDPHNSSDNSACRSPLSELSMADDGTELKQRSQGFVHTEDMIRVLDMKEVLVACARAVSEADFAAAESLMEVLGLMVSVSGDPMQRLGAYMLEGLRARLESSGSIIYRALKCEEPTSSELMSSMHVLYQICPYWKFAYLASNVVILEAVSKESMIHVVDFQIAQGTQWVPFIQALADRVGGPPSLFRITGIDDSQSAHARAGGLHIVGVRLSELASSCGVPFEFRGLGVSGCEVEPGDLGVRPGEALAVSFPFVLHHVPDESVSTRNHRDRILRLVRGFSPRVVTLVEQELNTNTASFLLRFLETLDYYEAMFGSIDVGRPRGDGQRISTEQHCVARDIVNVIACEGADRVERHELFGKWRSRFVMAGFSPCLLSSSLAGSVRGLLRDYHSNYRLEERNGALCMGWVRRALVSFSAWKT